MHLNKDGKMIPRANGIPDEIKKQDVPRDWHKKFKWDAIAR